jgi:CheY-like chemotaxis protein
MTKILVIEDDWAFQRLVVVALCERGYDAESADSAAAGLKKALRSRPDLIILDYNLGDMKAHDAAFFLELMKGTRAIPVVLLSGMAEQPEVREVMLKFKSCRKILSKRLLMDEIMDNIDNVLKGEAADDLRT